VIGCIFCEIVSGERPAAVVWETDDLVAFLDHTPLFPGHTLLVPREHHETIWDLPVDLDSVFLGGMAAMARAVRTAMGAEGIFLAMNNVVSQSVPHVHAHIVPRTKGDGLRGFFWPRTKYRDEAHIEETRSAIAHQLGSGE
jgi:histidine triad (HIT) family protein